MTNYQNTVSQVVNLLGDENSAADYLSKCIYSIGMGSNDYLNNYFMPLYYSTSNRYTPEQYADVLLQDYSQQLRVSTISLKFFLKIIFMFFDINVLSMLQLLYQYGARKMVLFGLGQIGCSPNELAQNSPDGSTCVQRINSALQIFNNKMKSLVNDLNSNLADAKFIFVDSYGIFQDIISSPSSYGK